MHYNEQTVIVAKTHTSYVPPADVPDGTTAMSLAAPAVALANSSAKPVGHTAPLLPTPPSMATALNPIGPASLALGITPPVVVIELAYTHTYIHMHTHPHPQPATPLISLMSTVATQALGITPLVVIECACTHTHALVAI